MVRTNELAESFKSIPEIVSSVDWPFVCANFRLLDKLTVPPGRVLVKADVPIFQPPILPTFAVKEPSAPSKKNPVCAPLRMFALLSALALRIIPVLPT